MDRNHKRSTAAYALTILLSAFLLFQIEPIVAKYILPWFGGGSEVWTTCLLFFQVLLVAGYAYAHWLETSFDGHSQAAVHAAVVIGSIVGMALLGWNWRAPILPGLQWRPADPAYPIARILLLLGIAVGLPYFVLSATGPLLQAWHARIHRTSPYRLYALSNFGSLLALLSYPFAIEPWISLRSQALAWSCLYAGFAIGMGICAKRLWEEAPEPAGAINAAEPGLFRGQYGLWIAFAACPSLMLLATTNEITREVAPVPFLWVLPLALYLLSFVLCFDSDRWYRREIFFFALIVAIGGAVYTQLHQPPAAIQLLAYSTLLFVACMVGHGELSRIKPPARHLTAFYIAVSVGGAVGGIVAAVIAPLLFRGFWEFQLALWLSAAVAAAALMRDSKSSIHKIHPAFGCGLFAGFLLLPQALGIAAQVRTSYDVAVVGATAAIAGISFMRSRKGKPSRGLVARIVVLAGLISLAAVSLALVRAGEYGAVLSTRNFYGPLTLFVRYNNYPKWRFLELRNGQIVHGTQFLAPQHRDDPTTYYSPDSGIGLLLLFHPRRASADHGARTLRVGTIGLGAGTIAAYGQPGDYIRFYEINPAVIDIAAGPNARFSFIHDSRARTDIVPGDGRIAMEREVTNGHAQNFDVLVIDAFSGDSVPVHLLTREALAIYLRELAPGGTIVFNITNGYLDLKPVIKALADSAAMECGWIHYPGSPPGGQESDWVLLTRDPRILREAEIAPHVDPMNGVGRLAPWTDDYSSVFTIVK